MIIPPWIVYILIRNFLHYHRQIFHYLICSKMGVCFCKENKEVPNRGQDPVQGNSRRIEQRASPANVATTTNNQNPHQPHHHHYVPNNPAQESRVRVASGGSTTSQHSSVDAARNRNGHPHCTRYNILLSYWA